MLRTRHAARSLPGGDLRIVRWRAHTQTDAFSRRIDPNDARLDDIPFLQHIARMLDAPVTHFGDVDQSFDAIFDPHKRPERRQLCTTPSTIWPIW